MLTDKEKLKLYKETLESIQMSGHNLQSPDDASYMLSTVIDIAWAVLLKAGDIDGD